MIGRIGKDSEQDLTQNFNTSLEAGFLCTRHEIEEAQKLRYRVYCLARGFEDPKRFPDGLERDEHDADSLHIGVRQRASKILLGTLRLTLPNPAAGDNDLPVKVHCGTGLDQRVRQLFSQRDAAIAEFSRFAIPKQVTVRIAKTASPDHPTVIPLVQHTESIAIEDFTSISLGLLGMALKASLDRGITHWLVCIQPALARLLVRYGMHFDPAGPVLNFQGGRQPMLARIDDLLSGIHANRKDFFYLIRHFQDTVEDLHQPQIHSQENLDAVFSHSRTEGPGHRRSRNANLVLVKT